MLPDFFHPNANITDVPNAFASRLHGLGRLLFNKFGYLSFCSSSKIPIYHLPAGLPSEIYSPREIKIVYIKTKTPLPLLKQVEHR